MPLQLLNPVFNGHNKPININNDRKTGLTLKLLNKDVISFTSAQRQRQDETIPYQRINNIALEYYQKLLQNVEDGFKFLKSKVSNLTINLGKTNQGAAGMARIVASKDNTGKVAYEMDINTFTRDAFDAAVHEGYHILQFDNLDQEEFVRVQKMLAKTIPPDTQKEEKYNSLLSEVASCMVIPLYQRNREVINQDINKALDTSNRKRIYEILNGEIFKPEQKLLTPGMKAWIEKHTDEKTLQYLISYAGIEIKAHEFCMGLNEKPIIYNRRDINISKIRDIIAIKIYKEIAAAADEVLKRQHKSTITFRAA
jgi:hypothetical protein